MATIDAFSVVFPGRPDPSNPSIPLEFWVSDGTSGRNLLIAPPDISQSSVDPVTGEIRASTCTIELAYPDDTVARLLSDTPNPVATTIGGVSAGSLVTITGTWAAPLPPYIWLGDECMAVVSVAGSAPGQTTLTVIRAQLSTQISHHESGTSVYVSPPGLTLAPIQVWTEYRHESRRLVWAGYIETAEVSRGLYRVRLGAVDVIALLGRTTIGGMPAGPVPSNYRSVWWRNPPPGTLLYFQRSDSSTVANFETISGGGIRWVGWYRRDPDDDPNERFNDRPWHEILIFEGEHPARILRLLLGQTLLPGAQLGPLDLDPNTWIEFEGRVPLRADRVVVGWDGEAETPLELYRRIAQSYLIGLAVVAGRLVPLDLSAYTRSVESLASYVVADLLPPDPGVSGLVAWRSGTVRAAIDQPPWREDPDVITVSVGEQSTAKRARFGRSVAVDLNLTTLRYGAASQAQAVTRAWVYLTSARATTGIVLGVGVQIGDVVSVRYDIESPTYPDASGAVRHLTGGVLDIGVITAIRPRLDRYHTEVDVSVYTGDRLTRWRAPAAQIVGGLGDVATIDPLEYSARFAPGDVVQIVNEYGVTVATGLPVTAVTPTEITISGGGAHILAGRIVRLDRVDRYGIGSDPLGIGQRCYVFAADPLTHRVPYVDEPADGY